MTARRKFTLSIIVDDNLSNSATVALSRKACGLCKEVLGLGNEVENSFYGYIHSKCNPYKTEPKKQIVKAEANTQQGTLI